MGSIATKPSSPKGGISKRITVENAKMDASVVFSDPIVFSDVKMTAIKRGHAPVDMDDRWHIVAAETGDGNTIIASLHRSWTGSEIFRATFERIGGSNGGGSSGARNDAKWALCKFAWNTDTSIYRPPFTTDEYLTKEFFDVLNSYFP